MIALEAERADPDLGVEIDGGERVEYRSACTATERGVWDDGHVLDGFQWGVDCGDGYYAGCGFLLRAWYNVPWHPYSVLVF